MENKNKFQYSKTPVMGGGYEVYQERVKGTKTTICYIPTWHKNEEEIALKICNVLNNCEVEFNLE